MGYLEDFFNLKNKVAVVTGGNAGIGQAVAISLAKAGVRVVIFSRSSADATLNEIKDSGGDCLYIKTDITNESSVVESVEKVVAEFGSIDILLNNAGICMHQNSFEASIDDFKSVLNTNVIGQFLVAREVAKVMVKNKTKGSIINIASMSGSIVNVPQWQCSYNASKAALIHMTKSLAMEWVEFGIRVNSISPGYIGTAMSIDTPQELKNAWYPRIPMGRMGEPLELMPTVFALASNASGYTTGTDVIIDGGYVSL